MEIENAVISVNDIIKKRESEGMNNESEVSWLGFNLRIKTVLSASEEASFVDSVVESCFGTEHGVGEVYNPKYKDFAVRYATVMLYTNIEADEESAESVYDILYGTNLYDIVISHINKSQWEGMHRAVEDEIKYRSSSYAAMINQKAIGLFEQLGKIQEEIGNIFSGVDKADIEKIAGAISDGKIDEEALVKSYIKATK